MADLPITFLDWLVDDALDFHQRGPGKTSSSLVSYRPWDLQRYEDAVRRDLSALLNTRRTPFSLPGEPGAEPSRGDLPLVRRSVFVYGIQDPSSITLASERERTSLKRAILEAIRSFEPRLVDVSVELLQDEGEQLGPFELRFRITADILVADLHCPVEFDTLLKIENRAHKVQR
ncbi:MAG: type VI secretion system baseplate subunit TssE [Planctomycetes bacterium]|nr:type VI secretion system baseplate subunit TssE [Planctomycetota bacterium]